MASIGSKSMLAVLDEFNVLIEKVISFVIIPLSTIPYFWDFPEHDVYRTSCKSTFRLCGGVRYDYRTSLHYANDSIYSCRNAYQNVIRSFLMKTMAPAYFTALGTQSSAATIPVTLRQARKTGASDKVTDFTIPLFATIHLSGSTITLVSCSIGVMLMNGMPIAFSDVPTVHLHAWCYDDCSTGRTRWSGYGGSWITWLRCLVSMKQWSR